MYVMVEKQSTIMTQDNLQDRWPILGHGRKQKTLVAYLVLFGLLIICHNNKNVQLSAVITWGETSDSLSLIRNVFPPWQKEMLPKPSETPAGKLG